MSENSLLTRTRELILKHQKEGDSIADPMLTTLGFKERALTADEKEKYRVHQFDIATCYFASDDNQEVTIIDREWDRSKAFQIRGDRIEITLIARDLKNGQVTEEKFSWDEELL